MQNKKNRILLTGGHAGSTSYAVVEEIRKQNKDWEIYFIGGRSALEGKNTRALHVVNFDKEDVKYFNIITGRLQRKFTLWTIPSLLKIPIGFFHAFYLLLKINPDVVLSFGGYAAFPVVLASWLMRKKIILHEQTAAAGRANLYASKFVDKIALSRKSSKSHFPDVKIILTGNPISPHILDLKPKENLSNTPTVFVTGGASGSKSINNCVEHILEILLKKYNVVHQTGDLQYKYFESKKSKLPDKLKARYEVKSIIHSDHWPRYLQRADIIVSRSGANMVAEIMFIKRPAILIPLPIAYMDEQSKNAQLAKEIGLVEVIEQVDLTPEILTNTISNMLRNWNKYYLNAKKFDSPDVDASKNLLKIVEQYL